MTKPVQGAKRRATTNDHGSQRSIVAMFSPSAVAPTPSIVPTTPATTPQSTPIRRKPQKHIASAAPTPTPIAPPKEEAGEPTTAAGKAPVVVALQGQPSPLRDEMIDDRQLDNTEIEYSLPDEARNEEPTEQTLGAQGMLLAAMKKLEQKIEDSQKFKPQGHDDDDEDTKRFKMAAEEGFPARGSMGLMFSRAADGGKSKEFLAATTNAAKAEFRKRWAEGRYRERIIGKKQTERWQKIDTSRGVYHPFIVIVELEGGRSPVEGAVQMAIDAARSYCEKCIAMAGPWIRTNTMTGREEFLYLKKEVMEQFTECWETYEANEELWERDGKEHTIKNGSAASPPPNATPKAKNKAKAKGEKNEVKKDAKEITPFDAALKDATTLRKDMLFVQSQCHTIASLAKAQEDWAWAINMLDGLTNAKKAIDDAITGLRMKLMCEEPRDLKKCYTNTDFISEVSRLSTSMDVKVQAAVKEIRMIMRTHRSRQET